jgi:hypothetical protein
MLSLFILILNRRLWAKVRCVWILQNYVLAKLFQKNAIDIVLYLEICSCGFSHDICCDICLQWEG